MSHLNPVWVVLALGLLTGQVVLLAIRWRTIAAACKVDMTFVQALQLSFIGVFFNQVLPSTVGGDGARIWLLGRQGDVGWARATYSVLIDRVVGVFALALIVTACLPWTFELIHDPIARLALLAIGLGAIASAVAFVLIGTLIQAAARPPYAHPSSGRRVPRGGSFMPFATLVRFHYRLLDHTSFALHRSSMVLRKGGGSARQLCSGSVSHAAGAARFDCADIDCRLGSSVRPACLPHSLLRDSHKVMASRCPSSLGRRASSSA